METPVDATMTQNVNELPELDMLTVALVDDDPMWRFLTSTALRERGWVVEDYDSGFLLLDRLPSISADIVLIDAVMPVMDGFATCRELRKHPNGQSLPILMLTSLEDDESIRDAYDAGATDFFIKSTHWALLAERIRHLVRLNEIGRQLDRSNARLAKVHTAARAGTFDFDVASRVLRGPAGSFAVLGMENTRTQLNEEELMRLMDPDDRNQLREAVDAGVKGRRPFRVEFRLRSVAGDMRYVEAEGEPEFDAEGGLLMLHGLIRDQTDDRHRRQELERLSSHDPLTGLPNRNEFLRRLTDAIDSARATSRSVHVAVFDLDRFTQFNETLGQAAGDELICEVGRRIAAIAEQFAPGSSQDVPKNGPAADMPGMPTAWLARLPGDEFALMMHDIGDAAAAEALTQQATLRRQATTETLGLIDQETQARKDAAARQGQTEEERRANVQRVENDILATKRQTLTQALSEYRQHIDALNAEANRHLAEVQRIEEAKRQLSMSTEERVRDIRRQGMTEYEATEDRKRQIAEYQTKAREQLANGEFEQARQLAQKAMDLAAQVASSQTSEAKRGKDARKQSEQAVSQVTQLEAQSRQAFRNQEYEKANALMRQADELRTQLAQKTREADAQIAQGKDGVNQAIQRIRESEELLNQTLD
ncbi:MAG TPA: response regulator, partial [Burkholderiaceae bacterium]|nr:response regulator [Burkholderiaceae bacterium]